MKIKKVNQYTCDFCKTKKYSAPAMIKHEKHCTANPDRVCRMCDLSGSYYDVREIVAKLPKPAYVKERMFDCDYDKLLNEEEIKTAFYALEIVCPACALAVLRQSKYAGIIEFDYKAEVKSYFAEFKEEQGAYCEY